MSDYKGVHGTGILNYAGDVPNVLEGQLWYNSTAKDFRVSEGPTAFAWATGGNLGTARYSLGGVGTSTAALAFGGNTGPGNVTELWNGSNWTEVNALNTGRTSNLGGVGSSTAALAIGGNPANAQTELWNGTNWTEVNDLNSVRRYMAGAGTTTSAIVFGGFPTTDNTELYNGTNWTIGINLSSQRFNAGGAGTNNTSALAFGGSSPSFSATEEWNAGPATITFSDS